MLQPFRALARISDVITNPQGSSRSRTRLAAASLIVGLALLGSGCTGTGRAGSPASTSAPVSQPASAASSTGSPTASGRSSSAMPSGSAASGIYQGPVTELPSRFGSPSVPVPASAKEDPEFQEQESAPLRVCSSEASSAASLRKLKAAQTLVYVAGDTQIIYSALEFPEVSAAQAFLAEVTKANRECAPVAATADREGSKPGSRDLPAEAAAVVDEGRVLGYEGIHPAGSERRIPSGEVYFVARKKSVVIVAGHRHVTTQAHTPDAKFDSTAIKPILEAAARL